MRLGKTGDRAARGKPQPSQNNQCPISQSAKRDMPKQRMPEGWREHVPSSWHRFRSAIFYPAWKNCFTETCQRCTLRALSIPKNNSAEPDSVSLVPTEEGLWSLDRLMTGGSFATILTVPRQSRSHFAFISNLACPHLSGDSPCRLPTGKTSTSRFIRERSTQCKDDF